VESDQAYERLTEIAKRVEALEKSVTSLADTDQNRAETVAHLTHGNPTMARVLLCVPLGKNQQGIRAEYEAAWGSVSVGTIHGKLQELLDSGYIQRSATKGALGYSYSWMPRITHRLVKDLTKKVAK